MEARSRSRCGIVGPRITEWQTGTMTLLWPGAGPIGSFLDAGEIDEVIIHVIPIFIGEGIPLVEPRHRSVRLSLRSSESYPDGVVRLHYEVDKGA